MCVFYCYVVFFKVTFYGFSYSNYTSYNNPGLTPSNNGVPVEVSFLRKECLNKQRKKIQALDKQPEVVWQNTIMKKYHHCFTLQLQKEQHRVNTTLSKYFFDFD